jgi:protein ImuB
MYTCLHSASPTQPDIELLQVVDSFSPFLEKVPPYSVVFPIQSLHRLYSNARHLATEINKHGEKLNLKFNICVASNIDTCLLVACFFEGITLIPRGKEAAALGSIFLHQFFEHSQPLNMSLLDTFLRWGLQTCADLAALPEEGIFERLGPNGVYLRNLALGKIHRPLRVFTEAMPYVARVDLDYSIDTLEPLLFLFSRELTQLCERLRSQSQAAQLLRVQICLEKEPDKPQEYFFHLEFPVALDDSRTMLKLLQLHLEKHGPDAAVNGFVLQIEPVDPKRIQSGLFLPAVPEADKLHVTLARVAGMVGEANVGSPELIDTYRPDAFRLRPPVSRKQELINTPPVSPLRLALRLFRPAVYARVRVTDARPSEVISAPVFGKVMECSGPWRTSGDWWTLTPWARDEWDVELDDGGVYRIYFELQSKEWYVQAIYD